MTRTQSSPGLPAVGFSVLTAAAAALLLSPGTALADDCVTVATGVLGAGTTRGGLATLARTGSDLLLPLLGLGLLLVVAGVLLRRRGRALPPTLGLVLVAAAAAVLTLAPPTGTSGALAAGPSDACHPATSGPGTTAPSGVAGTGGDGTTGGGPVDGGAPPPVVPEVPWPVLLPLAAAAAFGLSRRRHRTL